MNCLVKISRKERKASKQWSLRVIHRACPWDWSQIAQVDEIKSKDRTHLNVWAPYQSTSRGELRHCWSMGQYNVVLKQQEQQTSMHPCTCLFLLLLLFCKLALNRLLQFYSIAMVWSSCCSSSGCSVHAQQLNTSSSSRLIISASMTRLPLVWSGLVCLQDRHHHH